MFVVDVSSIRELREQLASIVRELDPGAMLPADAVRLVEEATQIERLAFALKSGAAAIVATSGSWRGEGDRSAEEWLGRRTGATTSQAAATVATGKRLAELPDTAAAVRAGELSPLQAEAIADASTANPAAEQQLLAEAARASTGELRNACKRAKAAADTDPDATRRRIHAARHIRSWTDADGTWRLSAAGAPEVGARIVAALQHRADQVFRAARAEGRREPAEAYLFDALDELTSSGGDSPALPKGANAKVIVRIDHSALLRGRVVDGETCEIAGVGPVSVSAVREAMEDAFIAAVLTKGTDICRVTHLGRKPTALQQTALQWRDPECSVLGCSRTARLQIDHRADWADTHVTEVDQLDRYCSLHHRLKTIDGWMLEEGAGKRRFLPPGDPDHPLQRSIARSVGARRSRVQSLCESSRMAG